MFRPSNSQRCVWSQLAAFRRLYSQQQHQQRLPTTQPSYTVKRSHQGNLPVYGDIRNAGSRYLIYIRNVTGAEVCSPEKNVKKKAHLLRHCLGFAGTREGSVGNPIPSGLSRCETAQSPHEEQQTRCHTRWSMEKPSYRMAYSKGPVVT